MVYLFTCLLLIFFFAFWVSHLKKEIRRVEARSEVVERSCEKEKEDVGKDFISNASHELRTPITIIKGFAETLKDLPDISPAVYQEILEKILKNCERMDSLIRNLLLLADLENGQKSAVQECDLVEKIDAVSYGLISLHQEATIEIFASTEHAKILANGDLLELALRNLLENAVKYAKGAPQIQIRLEIVGSQAEVTILDRGIGIPAEDLPHIFSRFYTVNKAHSRKLGGAGLGLSIVKKIIENHGGTIRVSSAFGDWTQFVLTFPLAVPALVRS